MSKFMSAFVPTTTTSNGIDYTSIFILIALVVSVALLAWLICTLNSIKHATEKTSKLIYEFCLYKEQKDTEILRSLSEIKNIESNKVDKSGHSDDNGVSPRT